MGLVDIRVQGVSEIIAQIQTLSREYPQELGKALTEEAEAIMLESQSEVPTDTESLKNSKFIDAPKVSSEGVSIKLGYGGEHVITNPKTGDTTDSYAINVHEDLTVHHTRGKAKFLEDPARRRASKIFQNIKAKTLEIIRNRFR